MDDLRADVDRITGHVSPPLFRLGRAEIAPSALEALAGASGSRRDDHHDPSRAEPYLSRHAAGEWPDISEAEREANLSAIEGGHAIVSRYALPGPAPGPMIFVRTDAEISPGVRPRTTVHLADTMDLYVCRGEEARLLVPQTGSPTGYRSMTGAFSTTEEAIDAFITTARMGPFPYRPTMALRFFELETAHLLRRA